MAHARIFKHVEAMAPDELSSKADLVSYVTPILGALAGNPKVTSKDVVKAAAQAAADGKIQPSEAVKFLTTMPSKPDDLRPWLKSLYAANMTALVHMKAAMMPAAPVAAAPVAPAQAPPAAVAAPVAGAVQ